MLHKVIARRRESSSATAADITPVTSVLGSLNVSTQQQTIITCKSNMERNRGDNRKPLNIQDVPFRRQDIRILNARNRRMMDRKLILFLVSMGMAFLFLGGVLLLIFLMYQHENKNIRPMIVIGPVMLAAGIMTIMCSLEICLRLYKANKRVQDPDLDNLTNPHEVKHWMDPNIIPYGWGMFNKGEHEKQGEESPSCVMIPILSVNNKHHNMGEQEE